MNESCQKLGHRLSSLVVTENVLSIFLFKCRNRSTGCVGATNAGILVRSNNELTVELD